jgi:hypothetical protein
MHPITSYYFLLQVQVIDLKKKYMLICWYLLVLNDNTAHYVVVS